MAYAFITSKSAGSAAGNDITTAAVDTSGATFLVVVVSDYAAVSVGTLSDSKSNTWSGLTSQEATGNVRCRIYYVKNPTVGASHTFTYAISLGYPSICMAAFSGAHLTSPFDVQNGASGTGVTTKQTGSVTPGEDNELLIGGVGTSGSSHTIGSSFTIPESVNYSGGAHFAGAIAYKIQTTAGAENPAFSWTTSSSVAAVIATFKAAAAVGHPTMRRWGGVPYVGGRGVNSAGEDGGGKMWGRRRSGLIVSRYLLDDGERRAA